MFVAAIQPPLRWGKFDVEGSLDEPFDSAVAQVCIFDDRRATLNEIPLLLLAEFVAVDQ